MNPTHLSRACMAVVAAAALALLAAPPVARADGGGITVINEALAASARPAEDKARDAQRKPAPLIAFAGIQPGQSVADISPGGGYYTRLFSSIVGAKGHVYAVVPEDVVHAYPKAADGAKAIAADPAHANVEVLIEPLARIAAGKQLDVAWMSDAYHDIYNFLGAPQALAMDKAIFQALKPGGIYMVIDHVAVAGTPQESATKMHRIDPEVVKQQALQAGFTLIGTSDILRNSADAHDAPVFSPAVRGQTDQFVMQFKKPGA